MDHAIELQGRKLAPEALAAARHNFSDSHVVHLSIRAHRVRVILSLFAIDLLIGYCRFLGVKTPLARIQANDQKRGLVGSVLTK